MFASGAAASLAIITTIRRDIGLPWRNVDHDRVQRARCVSRRCDEGVLAGASHADDDAAVLAAVEAEEDQLCLVAMQQFEAAATAAAV